MSKKSVRVISTVMSALMVASSRLLRIVHGSLKKSSAPLKLFPCGSASWNSILMRPTLPVAPFETGSNSSRRYRHDPFLFFAYGSAACPAGRRAFYRSC